MKKIEMAISFLKMAGNGAAKEAFEKFVAPTFIHHNQYFKGDRQLLLTAIEEAHLASPNKSIEVKKAYEDGNTAIIHSEVIRQNPNDPSIAVVHIFRFENNLVVELWDLGQEVAKNSPNENGPF